VSRCVAVLIEFDNGMALDLIGADKIVQLRGEHALNVMLAVRDHKSEEDKQRKMKLSHTGVDRSSDILFSRFVACLTCISLRSVPASVQSSSLPAPVRLHHPAASLE
jgi:hypothetical protein